MLLQQSEQKQKQMVKAPSTSPVFLPSRDYHSIPVVLHPLIKECISSALQH